MFVIWHTAFPTAVLVYVLSKDVAGVAMHPGRSTSTSIIITVVCLLAVIAGLSWIVAAKTEYLPSFYTTDVRLQTRLGNQVNFSLWLWVAIALAALLLRRRTILDLWLIATLLAWMPNFLVAALSSSVRFSVGWYAARAFVLIASCMVLTGLLIETTFLYSCLASAIILQRRERTNRLLSVDAVTAAIAHELRTPLAAIALNASTALGQLRSNPPELEEMDGILSDIEADSHRVGAIISTIRELTKKTTDRRTLTRVEDIVQLVLRLLQYDLLINEVSVATEFQDYLPEVHLDSIQLQQVLVNLIKNAIDAMALLLSVQDSGPGIPVEDQERIFDPVFSAKPGGTGLGLAISFTVIANQGGNLRLVKSDSDGSIFEIKIPVSGKTLGGLGASGCQRLADAVEKVEDRTTPKISQMVIFELLRCCDAR
jgi:signal transduction histidine kinase